MMNKKQVEITVDNSTINWISLKMIIFFSLEFFLGT